MRHTAPRFRVPWEVTDDGTFVLRRHDGAEIARIREHRQGRWEVEWTHRRGHRYSVTMEPSARDAQIIAEVALYGYRVARWLNPLDHSAVTGRDGRTIGHEEHYELEGRLVEVVWDLKNGEDYEVRIVRPEETNLTPEEFNAYYDEG